MPRAKEAALRSLVKEIERVDLTYEIFSNDAGMGDVDFHEHYRLDIEEEYYRSTCHVADCDELHVTKQAYLAQLLEERERLCAHHATLSRATAEEPLGFHGFSVPMTTLITLQAALLLAVMWLAMSLSAPPCTCGPLEVGSLQLANSTRDLANSRGSDGWSAAPETQQEASEESKESEPLAVRTRVFVKQEGSAMPNKHLVAFIKQALNDGDGSEVEVETVVKRGAAYYSTSAGAEGKALTREDLRQSLNIYVHHYQSRKFEGLVNKGNFLHFHEAAKGNVVWLTSHEAVSQSKPETSPLPPGLDYGIFPVDSLQHQKWGVYVRHHFDDYYSDETNDANAASLREAYGLIHESNCKRARDGNM
mmetsp:Transcript_1145/g.4089  ORF Transcript_1145/g.4089 Transcript_1145/m.4089 type:complete len:363 (+) Transcript_1145:72-1160(+)